MKKVLFAALILIGATAVSCKKDRICSCTTVTTGLFDLSVTADTTLQNLSKKDAEDICTGFNESVSALGSTVTVTCELK